MWVGWVILWMGGKSIGSLTRGWLTAEVAVIKEGVASWVGGGMGWEAI